MGKHVIEHKLYEVIDQFNERKTNYIDYFIESFNNIHPINDDNLKPSKTLFARGYNFSKSGSTVI